MPTPTLTRIDDYLASLPKETLHYQPNGGNAGDSLIALGTYRTFHKLGIDFRFIRRGDDLTDKIVVYPGGGNLVPYYGDAAKFLRDAYPKARRLIILPHTIVGSEDLLASFGENADILCRDIPSFEYVRSINSRCNVYLVEDMAFAIDVAEALAGSLRARHPDPDIDRTGLRYQYQFLRKKLRYRRKCREELASFRRQLQERPAGAAETAAAERTLNCFRGGPEKTDAPIPWDNIDLPRTFATQYGRLAEYFATQAAMRMLRFMAEYDVVNANRLHVGIAGALLGKRVNLYPNSYFKNEAIYNLSLKDKYPNVRWMG